MDYARRGSPILLLCLFVLLPCQALAEDRLALLIGNEQYNEKVGALHNPHNDIEIVGKALTKVGFKVRPVLNVGARDMLAAIKTHIAAVKAAGPGAVNLIYYSGHGASLGSKETNYLIPIDAPDADVDSLAAYSLELKSDVLDRLANEAPTAVHYVVFDACRNELRLSKKGAKAIEVGGKGFTPVNHASSVLIAYATAPGLTASDTGDGSGPYARALSEELVKPGVPSAAMFASVQVIVLNRTGQAPWLTIGGVPEIYFAGRLGPVADIRVAPEPDTVGIQVGGYQAVTYRFVEGAGIAVVFETQDVQWLTLDGRPLGAFDCKECRLLDGNFRVDGGQTRRFVDNVYLPPEVVAEARRRGVNAVHLRTMFKGRQRDGQTIGVVAVLKIVFP